MADIIHAVKYHKMAATGRAVVNRNITVVHLTYAVELRTLDGKLRKVSTLRCFEHPSMAVKLDTSNEYHSWERLSLCKICLESLAEDGEVKDLDV